jgi:cytochrome c peroxidase
MIHQTEGFYHDGRFATLPDVVNHYVEPYLDPGLLEYLKEISQGLRSHLRVHVSPAQCQS